MSKKEYNLDLNTDFIDDDDRDEITEEEYKTLRALKAVADEDRDELTEEEYKALRARNVAKVSKTYSTSRRRRAEAEKARKKRLPVYWICLAIYTCILLILGWRFLKYTDDSLVKYENAQSDNAMKTIIDDFIRMAEDGSLADKITIPSTSGEFEAVDVYKNMYLSQFENVSSYTYEKDSASYLTEEPIYDIFADGNMVAKMTLSASNERTIFGILTIMDWNIAEILPVFSADSFEYTIKIPNTYTATVNGIALSENHLTGNVEENTEYGNISEYVNLPYLQEYKISGLANKPEIKVYDANGEEVSYTPDGNNITVIWEPIVSEIPKERYEEALKMAQTWDDFLTNDLSGASHGLATVQQYLIKDSYYWDMAESYAWGVDITLFSDHSLSDPPYSNISLTDYVSYDENCYSVHIYFDKNMRLTETGQIMENTMDSTFYFVYIDDTDDGADNPHWAIADMIATTN